MALIALKQSQKAKKVKDLQLITNALKNSKAVYLSDYRGLTMSSLAELRNKLGANGTFMVIKNTIFAKAAQQTGKANIDPEAIKGPSAALFSYDDEVSNLKLLVKFAKEHNELPLVKYGILDGQLLNQSQVVALSKLPSKEQLRGQVVATLAAPLTGFVSVLNGNIRNLVYALNEVQKKKAA